MVDVEGDAPIRLLFALDELELLLEAPPEVIVLVLPPPLVEPPPVIFPLEASEPCVEFRALLLVRPAAVVPPTVLLLALPPSPSDSAPPVREVWLARPPSLSILDELPPLALSPNAALRPPAPLFAEPPLPRRPPSPPVPPAPLFAACVDSTAPDAPVVEVLEAVAGPPVAVPAAAPVVAGPPVPEPAVVAPDVVAPPVAVDVAGPAVLAPPVVSPPFAAPVVAVRFAAPAVWLPPVCVGLAVWFVDVGLEIESTGSEPTVVAPLLIVCEAVPPFAFPLVAVVLPELVCVFPVDAPPVAFPDVAEPPGPPAPPVAVEVTGDDCVCVLVRVRALVRVLEFVVVLEFVAVFEPVVLCCWLVDGPALVPPLSEFAMAAADTNRPDTANAISFFLIPCLALDR